VGIGSIALNAGGDWLLMQILGHWGIALVTSIVSYINTLVLYAIFRHRHGPLDESLLVRRLAVHLLLATVLGVCLFVLSQPLAAAPGSLMTPVHLFHFAAIMTVGGGLYLALGFLFKVEEIVTLGRKVMWRLTQKP
jgi:peptidoglycan biosynthesis protein MviN/MurJ (putative lipid II flippase)